MKEKTNPDYVYTTRFEHYSRGIRKAGTAIRSAYIDVCDEAVIARWLKRGYIKKARK